LETGQIRRSEFKSLKSRLPSIKIRRTECARTRRLRLRSCTNFKRLRSKIRKIKKITFRSLLILRLES